jgi:protein LSM14
MGDIDSLIGSSISLISNQDVRYDGVLFSINTDDSCIILKDVKCLGTEDRVTDPARMQAGNGDSTIAFVTFPGGEIKDLIVHESTPAAVAPAAALPAAPKSPARPPPAQKTAAPKPKPQNIKPAAVAPPAPPSGEEKTITQTAQPVRPAKTEPGTAGTGAHLLKLKEKKGSEGQTPVATGTTFDFETGLNIFKKDEVLAAVAKDKEDSSKAKYVKDDFFDTMSCDLTDRQEGIKNRLTYSEERSLNQDTFGAIALQNNNYRGNYRGGRGRGGVGRGPGQGRGGGRGYGGGRGGYNNNGGNTGYNNNSSSGGSSRPTNNRAASLQSAPTVKSVPPPGCQAV